MQGNNISAVIFDMDGVISDTQKLHAAVESRILKRYGIKFSPAEISRRYAGVKTIEFFNELLSQQPRPYRLEDLMREKWAKMSQLAARGVDAIDGSVGLVKDLHKRGYKLAVASASNHEYVANVIWSLKLHKYFDHLVSGDMVKRGKPDPEIFLLAASKLGVAPKECLVIEDGISGMEAARAGGMRCIGLVQDRGSEYPTKNLVQSLREITPGCISLL